MGETIFISLASYRDPMLFFTLKSAYEDAKHPENLIFGVVDQSENSQRPELESFPFKSQIRYCHISPEDTLGVSWARGIAFSLYNQEDYLLQVDSHTCFEKDWDVNLLDQYSHLKTQSPKPLLSTYPYSFRLEKDLPLYKKPTGNSVLVLRPRPDQVLSDENVVLKFKAYHLYTDHPVLGCHMAAGFVFCEGKFIEEVPYDPYMYFHGEEQSLSLRAFTRGWDIYHPKWIPLYHMYKEKNVPHQTHHWYGEIQSRRDIDSKTLRERGKNRLQKLIFGDLDGSAYGLGSVRTLEEYTILSGIDYIKQKIDDVHDGRLV